MKRSDQKKSRFLPRVYQYRDLATIWSESNPAFAV